MAQKRKLPAPTLNNLKKSLVGRRRDDGEPIDINIVLNQSRNNGPRPHQITPSDVAAACGDNGLGGQAADILLEARGIWPK